MTAENKQGTEHMASAKSTNLSISTKHSIELSKFLRNKNTTYAKKFLENVTNKTEAVPFKTHNRDVGHKKGPMAAGRYPINAARDMLSLVKSVEANAQAKGLNVGALKITKLIANKASIPMTGGRHRYGTKRTHLEIAVQETEPAIKKAEKKTEKPADKVVVESKTTEPVNVVKKEVEIKSETLPEVKQEVKVESSAKPVAEKKSELVKEEKKSVSEVDAEIKTKVVSAPVKKAEVKSEQVRELSSQELLKKAQENAAEINKNAKEHKDVEQVTDLFHKLQQKGTLRDKK